MESTAATFTVNTTHDGRLKILFFFFPFLFFRESFLCKNPLCNVVNAFYCAESAAATSRTNSRLMFRKGRSTATATVLKNV